MTRKGRKRQAGQREPCGRLARSTAEPEESYAPSAIKRLTDCAIRGVADAAYGTPLGRLYLDGRLSAAQFAAGQHFDRLTRFYLQAIAAPRPDPRSNALDYGPRSADIDPESRAGRRQMADHRAIVAAMGEARAVLAGCGKAAEAAVRGLCEARELPVGWSGQSALVAGLSALADHWHLGRGGRGRGM
jgi:hypothetical protein